MMCDIPLCWVFFKVLINKCIRDDFSKGRGILIKDMNVCLLYAGEAVLLSVNLNDFQ